MKITAIETIRLDEFANLLWLRVHTDEGLIGLGETFFMAQTVEAYVHEAIAPKLLGRDPLAIDRIAKDLAGYVGFRSTGAEMRGNSAFDIALWDIFGKVTGQPIAQLLGGFTRERIRTYNTCAGIELHAHRQGPAQRAIGASAPRRDYDDLNALPEPRRRAGRGASRRGHHGDEDLAVRPRRREERRQPYLARGPEDGARPVREDPQGGRRPAWRSWSSSTRSGSSCRRSRSPRR